MKHLHLLAREIEKAAVPEGRGLRQFLLTLYGTARRFGFHYDDAKDIVYETLSEVLIKVYTHEFHRHASLQTFAYQINKNICLNRLRKSTRLKHGGNAPHLSLDQVHVHRLEADPHRWNPLEILKKKERQHLTLQGIQTLDNPEYREVLLLRLKGYDRKEISAALNIPPTRVDAILSYGKKKLCKSLRNVLKSPV